MDSYEMLQRDFLEEDELKEFVFSRIPGAELGDGSMSEIRVVVPDGRTFKYEKSSQGAAPLTYRFRGIE